MHSAPRDGFARALALGLSCALAVACEPAGNALNFSVDFASAELKERAELVEVALRKGGCSGQLVFTTQITRSNEGVAPGALEAGKYGFSARARDRGCLWFAQDCREATLPLQGNVALILQASTPLPDPTCSESDGGFVPGDGDGGHDELDAGRDADLPAPDAGDGDGDGDGDGADGDDAGPGFDETAPKCEALPDAVVACYDFEESLVDASRFGNDATGDAASFEPGRSGLALRPNGTAIAVEDDPSLNFAGAFTIEMWIRVDSLINVRGEVGAVSLLLDKDLQYDLAMLASGELAAELYRSLDRATDVTGPTLDLGEFTYVAWVYDGTRTILYRDGQQRASAAVTFMPFAGNGGTMHIGTGSPDAKRGFNGLIDALRMWSRSLEPAEICGFAGGTFDGSDCL